MPFYFVEVKGDDRCEGLEERIVKLFAKPGTNKDLIRKIAEEKCSELLYKESRIINVHFTTQEIWAYLKRDLKKAFENLTERIKSLI